MMEPMAPKTAVTSSSSAAIITQKGQDEKATPPRVAVLNEDKARDVPTGAAAQITWSRRTIFLVVGLLLAVVFALGIVVGIVLSSNDDDDSDHGSMHVDSSDDSVVDKEAMFLTFLSSRSFDGGEALRLYASPQRTALRYISLEFPSMPLDEKLIDLYVVACFFFSTGGTFWTNNSQWKSASPVCLWYGIDCDDNGYVVSIALTNNHLRGNLPPELGLLAPRPVGEGGNTFTLGLTNFDVSFNNIKGNIPEQVSLLSSMKELNLSNNDLSGEIPASLGNMTALEFASFANNDNLRGQIPTDLCKPADQRPISVDCDTVSCQCCLPSCG